MLRYPDRPPVRETSPAVHRSRLTRRQFLTRAAETAAVATAGGGAYALISSSGGERQALRAWRFHSRPDLHPPVVRVSGHSPTPGYLVLGPGTSDGAQAGPLLVDGRGDPAWYVPLGGELWASNVRVSQYDGRPVLMWWAGTVDTPVGYGRGEGVILDSSYRELRRLSAVDGRQMDVHELRLTTAGTALFTCFPLTVEADLREVGGSRYGRVLESVFQEVDLRSGRLLLEWRSLGHIPIADSYRPPADPYDYLHINSIDIAPDGHFLVSARHTWALYKLHRRTGEVIWRLGGKHSDFAMGPGAQFFWQHDAAQLSADRITVFDDGSDGATRTVSESRGVVLAVDETARTARLAHAYRPPKRRLASAMGSMQTLPNGHVLVGWGTEPYASEFAADGRLVSDVQMLAGKQSYRAFRLPWSGTPTGSPAVAAVRHRSTGTTTLYVSWNGATEVARWQLRAGPSADALRPYRTVMRNGFETAIGLGSMSGHCAVTALDAESRPIATSATIHV